MRESTMHRQVFILASAQALFQIASVMVMTVGGLAGAQIAQAPQWATLPIAAMFLGTATVTFPASMWMARVGRSLGFRVGTLLGVAGGLIAALGVWQGSLLLLSLGTYLVGGYQGFAQFYRFAASEVSTDVFRSRAISLVLAGSIVAALLGPTLARFGGPLFATEYVGSFLILAVVSLLATGVLMGLHVPASTLVSDGEEQGRRWLQIVTQPAYLVALFGALTGYGIMILAMTATPLAMAAHHHDLAASATVIQFHVLGMFLPSFFTGSLIARFGVLRIMLAGIFLFLCHILTVLSGTGFASFVGALILLGVGWNFLYVGGTTLLTTTYTPAEKARAQATNDVTIFIVGLICSFSAGILLQALGWQTMNLILLPWLGIAAAAIVWFGLRERRVLRSQVEVAQ